MLIKEWKDFQKKQQWVKSFPRDDPKGSLKGQQYTWLKPAVQKFAGLVSKHHPTSWTITSVHMNDTIRIQCGTKSEWLNIQRVTPFLTTKLKTVWIWVSNYKKWNLSLHSTLTHNNIFNRLFSLLYLLSWEPIFDLKTLRSFIPFLTDTPFVGASDIGQESAFLSTLRY